MAKQKNSESSFDRGEHLLNALIQQKNQAKRIVALKELSPKTYETLLVQWRNDHQRRSNLWKAMKQLGLI
ncbi:MAG: hypothetical protein KME43_16440 [Myxacorys chilensis ATA2-1-KO14]|jgi:isochorismate hydrolase|nr:hypothetical protein [Myxacorys chilensis ATA2-1-KO14]